MATRARFWWQAHCVQTQGSPPVGALWVVRADNRAAVQVLIETDPFRQQGLRASCEILHWSKAFPGRTTPV